MVFLMSILRDGRFLYKKQGCLNLKHEFQFLLISNEIKLIVQKMDCKKEKKNKKCSLKVFWDYFATGEKSVKIRLHMH